MARYEVTRGVRKKALRVVIYGSEGIGKSTLASKFPDPVFIDVEGGTNQLDIQRLPDPIDWNMLVDEIRCVRNGDVKCSTLVVDTADAMEAMCIDHVCRSKQWDSIETLGYGKGWTFLAEEFKRAVDMLGAVVDIGVNVVVLCHSTMRKFDRPDDLGSYDRFELKLSKKISSMLKEWCDMLLFCDYQTDIVYNKDKTKAIARGGHRIIHTTHAPSWDAKNRFGLKDTVPMEWESISDVVPHLVLCGRISESGNEAHEAEPVADGWDSDHMRDLKRLMDKDGVTEDELRQAVAARGDHLYETDPADYGERYVRWLTTKVWPSFVKKIEANREIPFDVADKAERE